MIRESLRGSRCGGGRYREYYQALIRVPKEGYGGRLGAPSSRAVRELSGWKGQPFIHLDLWVLEGPQLVVHTQYNATVSSKL